MNLVLYDFLDFEITSYLVKLIFCAGGHFGMAVLILGPIMKWSMKWERPILEKWGLC